MAQDLVERLRELGSGREVWRVQDIDDKSCVVEFEVQDYEGARAWWRFMEGSAIRNNKEIAKVRIHSPKDLALLEAASVIERLRSIPVDTSKQPG